MLTYTVRRLVLAVPALVFISLIIFLIVKLSPSDPTAGLPLTIPPEVREQIRESLGVNQPLHIQYLRWAYTMFITEPAYLIDSWMCDIPRGRNAPLPAECFNLTSPDASRIISYMTRSSVMDLIGTSLPQTLWVVGNSYIVGILIGVPLGIISAYRQYSLTDQAATFFSMVGFSVPTFFTGTMAIIVFSVWTPQDAWWWLPSSYRTTHEVTDWDSFVFQIRQMIMPMMVLGLYNAAQISRYMRASMLDNLQQDYVRTARAKGMSERVVVLVHVLRNSLIPVVTVIALNVPAVFGGALITEQVFSVNGIGYQLIIAIRNGDVPTVQTISFIFAVLVVLFNLIADVLYGFLDPRIRYD